MSPPTPEDFIELMSSSLGLEPRREGDRRVVLAAFEPLSLVFRLDDGAHQIFELVSNLSGRIRQIRDVIGRVQVWVGAR
jgi:hypothetical protein